MAPGLRRTLCAGLVCAGLVCAAALVPAAAQNLPAGSGDLVLRVGVRVDASPFSYKAAAREQVPRGRLPPGPLRQRDYAGYMVNVCDFVLFELEAQERGLTVEPVVVNAQTRWSELDKGGAAGGIDILCDPATITDNRLYRFLASAPIYLSGITFASLEQRPMFGTPCASLVGAVGDTTAAERGIRQILETGNLGTYAEQIWNFMDDSARWRETQSLAQKDQAPACVQTPGKPGATAVLQDAILYARSHDDLADAFCRGDVLHYVGDIEIVNRKLRARSGDCVWADGALTYSDERYAIFANVPDSTEARRAHAILRFFELLSRRIYSPSSALLESFDITFPDYRPSRKLQAFYWSMIGTFPGAAE